MPSGIGGRWRLGRTDVAWLSGQGVLFVLAFVIVPRGQGLWGRVAFAAERPLGWGLMAIGAAWAGWSMLVLGRQLVPQPTPVEGGQLVDRGPYRVVRHPIYLGVLLLVAGAVARTFSLTGVAVTVVTLGFFAAKSRHEETLLVAAYPAYERYREQVRWLVLPGVV